MVILMDGVRVVRRKVMMMDGLRIVRKKKRVMDGDRVKVIKAETNHHRAR